MEMSYFFVYHMSRYLIYHPRYVCLVRLAQITCAPPLSNLNLEVLRIDTGDWRPLW